MTMWLRGWAALALFISLGQAATPASATAATCIEPSIFGTQAYTVRARSPLQSTQFGSYGTLAIRIDKSRYYVLETAACYDLSRFSLPSELKIVFNHRTDGDGRDPTYIGFQTVRAIPGLDADYLKFERNTPKDSDSEWLLPRERKRLADLHRGASLPGTEAEASRGHERALNSRDTRTPLFDLLNNENLGDFVTTVGDWHAAVARGASAAPAGWSVTTNSALQRRNWRLSAPAIKSAFRDDPWIIANYLFKYTPSSDPKVPVDIDIGVRKVACLYIRPVANEDDLPRLRISDPIALKLKRGVECADPKEIFQAAAQ